MSHPQSAKIDRGPCMGDPARNKPPCGSLDSNAIYDDGHTHCFKCGAHPGDAGLAEPVSVAKGCFTDIEYTGLKKRRISEETCRFWSYGIHNGNQVAQYLDSHGAVIAQKIRTPDKEFEFRGQPKKVGLYGRWLWAAGQRMLVITTGELDALSMSELQNNKWPVVSVPHGDDGAEAAIRKDLEFVESFEKVVLMFDMDETGQRAALAVAALLTPGKAFIAKMPMKDASDLLQAGRGAEAINAMWRAEAFRPGGILDADQLLESMRNEPYTAPIAKFPFEFLSKQVLDYTPGEIVIVGSGTGNGKTEFIRQCALAAAERDGKKIGYMALEEKPQRSAIGLVGMSMGRRLNLEEKPLEAPGFDETWARVIAPHFCFYDHRGSMDEPALYQKIRYMRIGMGCDIIVLDHISIVVSGLETEDERRTIDMLMTKLNSICQETGVAVLAISHMKQPQKGPSLEEGGHTAISLFRGSGSIAQIGHTLIGLERNQQSTDCPNRTTVRVLKARRSGRTGVAGYLQYDATTGRLSEDHSPAPEEASSYGFKKEPQGHLSGAF